MIPTELSQLYPANTPLKDVKPDFRGMDPWLWRKLKLIEQCEAWRQKRIQQFKEWKAITGKKKDFEPWMGPSEWRPGDSYGMKSV